MILNRRLPRDFLNNLVRNLAMILIVALSIALVTALCTNTECLNYVIHDEWEKCNVEDGSFETYVPLSKRNMLDLADLDVTIEKMFYTDVPVNDVSVLRFFVNRKKINLAFVEQGRTPQSDNELFMEKLYAKNHGLSVGDTVWAATGVEKIEPALSLSEIYKRIFGEKVVIVDRSGAGNREARGDWSGAELPEGVELPEGMTRPENMTRPGMATPGEAEGGRTRSNPDDAAAQTGGDDA